MKIRVPLKLALGAAIVATIAVVGAQQPVRLPIADAAKRADREAVRGLLKQGADVSAAQPDGMTALHYAAERGDLALVDMLLYAGANTAVVTRIGQDTTLHLAAREGSGAVVRLMIEAGAVATTPTESGATALHLAAASGSAEAVNSAHRCRRGRQRQGIRIGTDTADFCRLHRAGRHDRTRCSSAAPIRRSLPRCRPRTNSLALDRQALALRRQILAATVPQGEQPTPAQEQAAIQAMRELQTTTKQPHHRPRRPRREPAGVAGVAAAVHQGAEAGTGSA